MAINMSLTLNALPVKNSGKDVSETAKSQPTSSASDVGQVARSSPADRAPESEGAAPVSIPRQELESAVNQMKDFAQMLSRELQFDVDDDLGRTVVRVLDKQSGDLIRQIPSAEVLELAKHIQEMKSVQETRLEGRGMKEQAIGLLMKTQA